MPRLPKNIVPVDPERQPHIKKFVTDGRRVGISIVSGKTNNKAVPKKRRRRSTGETKGKSEKRRTVIHSESSFVSEEGAESLTSRMAATTINSVSPSVTMLQEIKNMEERLKASMKENGEKEFNDMEVKLKNIIENSIKESIQTMSAAIINTISTNPVIQLNTSNIHALKEENKELQYLAAEQAKLKVQMTQLETRNLEYTLIMRGIREEPKETEDICCDKIYRELANMIAGSDPEERYTTAKTLTIRKCRRLGKLKRDRIRPVSIEFVHKEDHTYVLENRSYLSEGIFVDKEYPVEIERVRRSLLPILGTAKRMERYKDQSRMNYDKLVIQGKDYTLNNLHELPEDINCFKATSKSDDKTVGFFREANPLSNFHPPKFIHEGQTYISSEQFIKATKAAYFGDLDTHMKIMGCKTSFDCKQISWSIKNVDSKHWDAVAMSLCEPGIREKFVQIPHLMDILIRRTENKMIVECTKDRLWGTGTALSEESCLNRDRWITQGILGRILERIRNEFKSNVTLSSQRSAETYLPHTLLPHSTSLPPPGFEHPMITTAQKPYAFRPTLLPPVNNDAPLIETQVTGTTSQTTSKEPTAITSVPTTDPTPPSSLGVLQIHEVMDTQRPTSVSSETL